MNIAAEGGLGGFEMQTTILCLAALLLLMWVVVLKFGIAERDETIRKLKQEVVRLSKFMTQGAEVVEGARSCGHSDAPEKHPTRVIHRPQ